MDEKIAVIGLGYVGLPVALGFSQKYPGTIGFDINTKRIESLRNGVDKTGECDPQTLSESTIYLTSDPEDLKSATFFVVAVPTPIDKARQPDLSPVRNASCMLGKIISKGAVIVYESTVYPGVTEDICGPILAKESGLKQGVDFKLGYSPERINPGDKAHTLQQIVKVVSGEDEETLERVATAYGAIVDAGVFRAASVKVAEAAKVIENTQRDLNIALMNELAMIFDRIGIRTSDVLAAAGTKWNFLRFSPGLVGGHCIGVDSYYLTTIAEEVGYHPEVILSGRRINDNVGRFVAQRVVKLLIGATVPVKGARIGVLGLTFKENVSDLRNSRVPDIVAELREFGIQPFVHDPMAEAEEAFEEYGLRLTLWEDLCDLDAIIIAVPHKYYRNMDLEELFAPVNRGGVVADIKSVIDIRHIREDLVYWSL